MGTLMALQERFEGQKGLQRLDSRWETSDELEIPVRMVEDYWLRKWMS